MSTTTKKHNYDQIYIDFWRFIVDFLIISSTGSSVESSF